MSKKWKYNFAKVNWKRKPAKTAILSFHWHKVSFYTTCPWWQLGYIYANKEILIGLLRTIIFSLIVIVAFARKSSVQQVVSVEDFWGGVFTGFLVGYTGEEFIKSILGDNVPSSKWISYGLCFFLYEFGTKTNNADLIFNCTCLLKRKKLQGKGDKDTRI